MEKIIINSESLKSGVRIVSGVIGSAIIPILECVKFEIADNSLCLTGSDLETTISTSVHCESNGNFSFCFPFLDLKKLLDNSTGALEIGYEIIPGEKSDSHTVHVKSDNGKSKIPVCSAIDFPRSPECDKGASFNLSADDIATLKTATKFAEQKNTLRPNFLGVCLGMSGGLLHMYATDANTMFKSAGIEVSGDLNARPIIPAKAAKLACATFYGGACIDLGMVKKEVNNVRFSDETTSITTKVIDTQKPPDYDSVIPQYTTGFTVDRTAIIGAIKYALSSADSTTNACKFNLSENLKISACDLDNGKDAICEPVQVENNGVPEFEFSMNGEYAIKCMEHLGDKVTLLTHGSASKAFIIKGESEEISVIIPLML